jgi:hypothetical protein
LDKNSFESKYRSLGYARKGGSNICSMVAFLL